MAVPQASAWLTVLTLLAVKGLELQSFSYHPALLLVAGPVFFLCLPCPVSEPMRPDPHKYSPPTFLQQENDKEVYSLFIIN
eukprot:1159947-Pelagomonas_calceolata.AAC.5